MKSSAKRKLFERTVVTASGKNYQKWNIDDVRGRWGLSYVGEYDEFQRCDGCHTKIKKYVVVRNCETKVQLRIGNNCAKRLLYGDDAVYVSRGRYVSRIKRCYKKEKDVSSFFGWFRIQSNLPRTIKKTMEAVDRIGHPQSIEAAEKLARYYKRHRRFGLDEMLTEDEIKTVNNEELEFPENVTLSRVGRIKKRLKGIKEIADRKWIHCYCRVSYKALDFVESRNDVSEDIVGAVKEMRDKGYIRKNTKRMVSKIQNYYDTRKDTSS